MKAKKIFKMFHLLLALLVVTVSICSTGFTASAAYVTDGNAFYIAGDANSDGVVDICDLVNAAFDVKNKTSADLDGDGVISDYDLALIRALILGINNSEWTK